MIPPGQYKELAYGLFIPFFFIVTSLIFIKVNEISEREPAQISSSRFSFLTKYYLPASKTKLL